MSISVALRAQRAAPLARDIASRYRCCWLPPAWIACNHESLYSSNAAMSAAFGVATYHSRAYAPFISMRLDANWLVRGG